MSPDERQQLEQGTLPHYPGERPAQRWLCWADLGRKHPDRPRHCRAGAMRNGRCRVHGGMSPPPGPDHPTFKNGHRSRYAALLGKGDLARAVKAAAGDPELLSLRDKVAVVEGLVCRHLARLGRGEGGSWPKLVQAWQGFKVALDRGDVPAMEAAVDTLDGLISAGAAEDAQEEKVIRLFERQAKLCRAEWERMVDLHQTVPLEQAMWIFRSLALAVQELVPDITIRRQLASRFAQLVGKDSPLIGSLPANAGEVP